MAKRICGKTQYDETFDKRKKRKRALQYAMEIRKFEIELYWKRATYFWTLIAATFAGFFALSATENGGENYLFLVSCIGFVLSISWYLVNRGSKYWQENWERHVDALEDEFIGPLYKTTINSTLSPWWNLKSGYPYSVSKVNQLTSLFIAAIWLVLLVSSGPWNSSERLDQSDQTWLIAGLTALFVLMLLFGGIGGSQNRTRPVEFIVSGLD